MLEGFEVDVGGFVSAEGVSQLLLLKLLLLKFNAGGCWKFVTAFFSDKMEVCQKGGGVSQKEATFALCRAFLICCCYIYIHIVFCNFLLKLHLAIFLSCSTMLLLLLQTFLMPSVSLQSSQCLSLHGYTIFVSLLSCIAFHSA